MKIKKSLFFLLLCLSVLLVFTVSANATDAEMADLGTTTGTLNAASGDPTEVLAEGDTTLIGGGSATTLNSSNDDTIVIDAEFVGTTWPVGEKITIPFNLYSFGNYGEKYYVYIYDADQDIIAYDDGYFSTSLGITTLNLSWDTYGKDPGTYYVEFYSTYSKDFYGDLWPFYLVETSGKCGSNLTWKYDDGELTISGSGKMYDYTYDNPAPWSNFPVEKAVIKSGVTYIGDYAFAQVTYLESVSIPSSVTAIGDSAFWQCYTLGEITLPSKLKTIGNSAFADSAIMYVNIPSTVTEIGDSAFAMTSILAITIPDGVDEIADNTFASCVGLFDVTIPKSVKTIGDCAFAGCSNLGVVTYKGTKYSWNKIDIGSYNDCLTDAELTCTGRLAKPTITSAYGKSAGGANYLKWDKVYGANSYYVYRATSSSGTYSYIGYTSKTNYTDSSVYGGTRYYYKVKAVCAEGDGKYSYQSGYKSAVAKCAAPKVSGSTVASSGNVKLTWEKVRGASKYYVYRYDSGSGTYKYIKSTTGTIAYDGYLDPGTTGTYKVKAICSKGSSYNSAQSARVSVTRDCARPVISVTRNDFGKPKISWSKVDGASEYYIYRWDTTTESYKFLASTTRTYYTHSKAVTGKTYYYKVKAVCGRSSEGNSALSTSKSITAK